MIKNKSKLLVISLIISLIVILVYCYTQGFFFISKIVISPTENVTTIIYNRNIKEFPFSNENAFTIEDIGDISGSTTYIEASFNNLYFSPNGLYRVISITSDSYGNYLELDDFANNASINLTSRLQDILRSDKSTNTLLNYNSNQIPIAEFNFVNWTDNSGEMEINFSFIGNDNKAYTGNFIYNYKNFSYSNISLN